MRTFLYIFIMLNSISVYANSIKPDPNIKPIDVIYIQLKALQNNDNPFKNAGIEQTWEFAHPNNRTYTGPLTNFIVMMNIVQQNRDRSFPVLLKCCQMNRVKIVFKFWPNCSQMFDNV